jgi:diguanylate cyclase (GGDEF)-like protein
VNWDQGPREQLPQNDLPVYVADAQQEPLEWLTRPLESAGLSGITTLPDIDALSYQTRELARAESATPALALIVAEAMDSALLERCQRFRRLAEEAWLGVVLVICGPDSGSTQSAGACLDVIHLPGQRLSADDLLWRLRLAMKMLHERRQRLQQKQAFNTRIAQHRVTEARLNYLASHDELTDLANRSSFESALDKALLLGARRQITHALLYLDLDRFKLHNDAAGHGSGNYLLQRVANHLRGALPREYLISRLGSDEFAILLQGVDREESQRVAEQLRSSVAEIEPDGEQIVYHVGISIGVSLIPPGSIADASQALARAEQACYVAKTRGGNAVHSFSQEDDILQHLREDMHWAQPIRKALSRNQLFLAFQPILDVRKEHISHYEALVRIPQPLGGDDQSARFMLAAERLGLAQQIDLWVVKNAIDYLADNESISLGVNLSSHAFQENALLPLLQDKLKSRAVAPERLTFEITETAAIMNFADTRQMVCEMRDLGCRFALDDFGSGFSTFHYIKQFPIDMLKIDGSFIINVTRDAEDQAIVQSMIDIAHSLGKEVVAEFIEDAETLGMLTKMGIDHAQGYYIGRPSSNPGKHVMPRSKGELQ